jgi:hypothetical protein
MRLGISFPHHAIGADPTAIRDWAQAADDLGIDHLIVYEHIILPAAELHPHETFRYTQETLGLVVEGRRGPRGGSLPRREEPGGRPRDRRLHGRPALAPRVPRSSSSCSNVSPIASAAPVPAASRASFEG